MNTHEQTRFQALQQRYLTELTLRGKSPTTSISTPAAYDR